MGFSTDIIKEITSAAKALGIEPASLLAVAEVESGGKAFALVEGRREPLIRFEGHYFDRRLSGQKRQQARAQRLASPVAGAIANPATQAARWRLLARAAEIDHRAAHESVSWGIAQVMGAHWQWLGYAHIDALVAEARSGVAGQVRLMMRYIEKSGLSAALRRHDWESFARGYNGPGYKRSAYDMKIARAYEKYSTSHGQGGEAGMKLSPEGTIPSGKSTQAAGRMARLWQGFVSSLARLFGRSRPI